MGTAKCDVDQYFQVFVFAFLSSSSSSLPSGKNHDKTSAELATGAKPTCSNDGSPAEPLQIALAAGGIAMAAIDQRKTAAENDETTDAFTTEEGQVISSRVVGVVLRLQELERTLAERVASAGWVRKYGEEGSFGVLRDEYRLLTEEKANTNSTKALEKQLAEALKSNPLLRMNRAECLLALFLASVEWPRLEALGMNLPGGSTVDFIDAERHEVLLLE